jgi:hypothetical protein
MKKQVFRKWERWQKNNVTLLLQTHVLTLNSGLYIYTLSRSTDVYTKPQAWTFLYTERNKPSSRTFVYYSSSYVPCVCSCDLIFRDRHTYMCNMQNRRKELVCKVTLECWLVNTAVVKETVVLPMNCNLVNVTTKINVATVVL